MPLLTRRLCRATRDEVQSHKFMGGQLDDTFLRQLNYEIRQGLTSDMYDGWARVFQLRNRTTALLKMVIQASYMMLFLEAYQGEGNSTARTVHSRRDETPEYRVYHGYNRPKRG